jgi:hypothetical protein
MNGGNPIVVPHQTTTADLYGAGHPSVTHVNGKYYITYTDTTGVDLNGLGQYVLRSSDPTFQTDVEERGVNGWIVLSSNQKPSTQFAVMHHAKNVDWAYSDALGQFVVAINGILNVQSFRFYDGSLSPAQAGVTMGAKIHAEQDIEGNWAEGPGMFRTPEGHINPNGNALTVDVYRSVGCLSFPDSWRLAYSSMVLDINSFSTNSTVTALPTKGDFDGDGRTDRAVWRPSNGTWYVRLDSGFSCEKQFGLPGDIPVAGVYDNSPLASSGGTRPNDGLLKLAVFRPSTGQWIIWAKTAPYVEDWGLSGDIPVPADYNGDGKTEIAVWRPSSGHWYFKAGGVVHQWGLNSDIPVPFNYDGISGDDLAVWRPSNGTWYFRNGGSSFQWGLSNDVPIPGINPEQTSDKFAVWRPQSGNWFLPAMSGWPIQFGLPNDVPVPGDYNGDGLDEISIWRPSTGEWFHRDVTTYSIQWGLPGDIPANIMPSVYLKRY